MPGTEKIVDQVEAVLSDPHRIASFCIAVMVNLGYDWEAKALWEILLDPDSPSSDPEIKKLVVRTIEETERDKKLVNEILQGLMPAAGADAEEQRDAWYVIWGQEGEVQDPPEVRPAYVPLENPYA